MDIFVNKMSSAAEKKEEKLPLGRREKRRNRRKAGRDRRKSVNEGLVISLSGRKDRRSYRDRRQENQPDAEFRLPEDEAKEDKQSFSVIA